MLTEFHERYHRHGDMRRTVQETMDELFIPMIFTSITTVVGFISLTVTPIPPVQVFGAFVAFGIASAWLLSVTFNIAYVMLLPKHVLQNFGARDYSHGWLARSMRSLGAFSLRFRKVIPVAAAVLLVFAVVGLTKVEVNDNPVKWFKSNHPLRVADVVMNEHLAGTYLAYLSVAAPEADGIKDPEVMRYIESLQRTLDAHPNVGATTSIADIVKKVGEELKSDPAAAVVPDSREEIGQFIFLYEMSGGDPADLFKMITPEADRANIWVQMHAGENRAVNSVVETALEFVEAHPRDDLEVAWAGLPYINVVWQQKMVSGMGKALAGSFVTVLIMMIFLFRSVRMGILSMIPLTVTIAVVYGFIGYVGKPYDMPIAVLSSLTLGLSIDFAIHFLQRTREYYRATGDLKEAMRRMFESPARAIARNILVIAIGFVPMFFANLIPYVTVGAFFFAIMMLSGGSTLLSLPAILSWMNPRFLAGKDGKPTTPVSQPATAS
jgi:predicted RND superfamily exporter protein